jgi:AraC-like DNA-binding protein
MAEKFRPSTLAAAAPEPAWGSARATWMEQLIDEAERAVMISYDPRRFIGQIVAELTARIHPPDTPLERRLAVQTIQRVAWQVLTRRVDAGQVGRASAFREFQRIVDASERRSWCELPRHLRSRRSVERKAPLAARLRSFVDAHSMDKVTLDFIARSLGCSVRTATAAFRSRYGITIYEYLTRCRLVHATTLLLTTDLKLSAIASSVGFEDKTALHRHYLRRTGMTPKAIQNTPHVVETVLQKFALPAADGPFA